MDKEKERNAIHAFISLPHLAVFEARMVTDGGVQQRGLMHEPNTGQAKVCQLDVPALRADQVVRLEIAVHNTIVVDVLDSQDSLRHIPARLLLGEWPNSLQQGSQITARAVLHHHIQRVLERVSERVRE